jgi:hypothetical protein
MARRVVNRRCHSLTFERRKAPRTFALPYRQIQMVWRLQGMWQYLRGDITWGALQRGGLQAAVSPE